MGGRVVRYVKHIQRRGCSGTRIGGTDTRSHKHLGSLFATVSHFRPEPPHAFPDRGSLWKHFLSSATLRLTSFSLVSRLARSMPTVNTPRPPRNIRVTTDLRVLPPQYLYTAANEPTTQTSRQTWGPREHPDGGYGDSCPDLAEQRQADNPNPKQGKGDIRAVGGAWLRR